MVAPAASRPYRNRVCFFISLTSISGSPATEIENSAAVLCWGGRRPFNVDSTTACGRASEYIGDDWRGCVLGRTRC